MPIITTYYCSRCRHEIRGIGEKSGKMDHCPHCGAYLKGLNKQHLSDLKIFYGVAIALTVFFGLAMFVAPPAGLCGILTGIWAYKLHHKIKAAKGS